MSFGCERSCSSARRVLTSSQSMNKSHIYIKFKDIELNLEIIYDFLYVSNKLYS